MHACRFVVCLAFVFGDVRSVHVNVFTEGAAGVELWTMVDLLKSRRRLGLLDKNYVVGVYVNLSFPLYKLDLLSV